MEDNTEYKAICSLMDNIERNLTQVQNVKNKQSFEFVRQEIEEHFGRCVHALEARCQQLIDELTQIFPKQESPEDILKAAYNKCKEIKELGIQVFKFQANIAELTWKEAQKIVLPAENTESIEVNVCLPKELLSTISMHGAVTRKTTHLPGSASSTTSCESKPNYNDKLIEHITQIQDNIIVMQKFANNLQALQESEESKRSEESKNKMMATLETTLQIVKVVLQQVKDLVQSKESDVAKSTQHLLELALHEEFQKQKEELKNVNDEKVLTAQRLQRVESELFEMKKTCQTLKSRSDKLKMMEKINDIKETDYQKLARAIGYEPTLTSIIFRELTNFGENRNLDLIKLIYHQISYWHVVELEELPVLQTVVNNYSNLIDKFVDDLDVLTHIFSGASLLLYMLYKNQNADLEDSITVEPLDIKQATQVSRRSSLYFNSAPQSPLGEKTKPSKLLPLRPLRSSSDFFAQLKAIVGKCFGLLLLFVAVRLDPLLDQIIFTQNYATNHQSLRPVISFLQKILLAFQVNLVHISLSQQFFFEVITRINNVILNGVMLRQHYCTELFGTYLTAQIEVLQDAAIEIGAIWFGDVGRCLQHSKQIAAVLTLPNKNSLVDDKVRNSICPSLNSIQLRQLLSLFTPQREFEKRVPIPIINAVGMRAPQADTDRILCDVNVVRPFPIKVLHYLELADIHKTGTATPMIHSFVESITGRI